jgi:hypothetical protein
MSTYLTLCQNMARDIGIPGSGPSSVSSTSLSEEENSVVRYVKEADLDIQRRWFDWNFLWKEVTMTSSSGTSTLTSPSDLASWNVDKVIWDLTSDDNQQLEYMEWGEYFDMYKLGTVDSSVPEVFSVKPDNVLDLYPTPNSNTSVYGQYWKVPTELSTDTQVSEIPPRFHKIIVARAKMYYAENEDAPEILAGSLVEFEDLLDKLEADQLPSQKNRRFSKAQDLFNFTVVPE